MNPNFKPRVLRFVQVASALTKRALDELKPLKQSQQKAAEFAPQLADLMVQTETIREDQKQAAVSMLGDHAQTQQLLKKAIEKIAEMSREKTAGDLGKGVDPADVGIVTEKEAADWSLDSGYCGERTSKKKASDEAMLRVLNNPA